MVFPRDNEFTFPQFPTQEYQFRCLTEPNDSETDDRGFLITWFLRVDDEPVTAPHFGDFDFRLTMSHSSTILFRNDELGNSLSKWMYERLTGGSVEQHVSEVTYTSSAPWWTEMVRKRRTRRMLRNAKRKG